MPLAIPVANFTSSSHPMPCMDALNNTHVRPCAGKVHPATVLEGDLIHESPPALHRVLPCCRVDRSLTVRDANSLNHRRSVICFSVAQVELVLDSTSTGCSLRFSRRTDASQREANTVVDTHFGLSRT